MIKHTFTFIFLLASFFSYSQAMQGPDNVFIGTIKKDGSVLDETNKVIGKFKNDGTVLGKNSIIIGFVANDGHIENEAHKTVGTYKSMDGTVYDAENKQVGIITPDGIVKNQNGEVIGYAKDILARWAAAYFFFLF